MLYLTDRVTGGVLWANINLLFWLSLVPFATAWMGENGFTSTPTAVYGSHPAHGGRSRTTSWCA